MAEHLILLTNDDGMDAPGLVALREVLKERGRLVVVAPTSERSASSHGLTLRRHIPVIEKGEDWFGVEGTPADCVIFALHKILPRRPDLVVSGINDGPNLGDDVLYSGTVAAAREASMYEVPSLAVSLASRDHNDFRPAAEFFGKMLDELRPERLLNGTFLNVNFPHGEASSFRFTRQGNRRRVSAVVEEKAISGGTHYWIGADQSERQIEADSDYRAIQEGVVSVTPLHRDQTDYRALGLFNGKSRLERSS